MTSATKSFDQAASTTIGAKLAQLAFTVVATVLMLELRESISAKAGRDQSDAAFTYGL